MELSLDEVKELARRVGFDIKVSASYKKRVSELNLAKSERTIPMTYTGIPDGMLRHEYQVRLCRDQVLRVMTKASGCILDRDQAEASVKQRKGIFGASCHTALQEHWPDVSIHKLRLDQWATPWISCLFAGSWLLLVTMSTTIDITRQWSMIFFLLAFINLFDVIPKLDFNLPGRLTSSPAPVHLSP